MHSTCEHANRIRYVRACACGLTDITSGTFGKLERISIFNNMLKTESKHNVLSILICVCVMSTVSAKQWGPLLTVPSLTTSLDCIKVRLNLNSVVYLVACDAVSQFREGADDVLPIYFGILHYFMFGYLLSF